MPCFEDVIRISTKQSHQSSLWCIPFCKWQFFTYTIITWLHALCPAILTPEINLTFNTSTIQSFSPILTFSFSLLQSLTGSLQVSKLQNLLGSDNQAQRFVICDQLTTPAYLNTAMTVGSHGDVRAFYQQKSDWNCLGSRLEMTISYLISHIPKPKISAILRKMTTWIVSPAGMAMVPGALTTGGHWAQDRFP